MTISIYILDPFEIVVFDSDTASRYIMDVEIYVMPCYCRPLGQIVTNSSAVTECYTGKLGG